MDLIEQIAQNVEKLRRARGASRRVLSEMSGVPYQTLCNLEKRRVGEPRVHTLLMIAEALGTTLDALCGESGGQGVEKKGNPQITEESARIVAHPSPPATASQVISIPLRITVTPESSQIILRQDSRIDFSIGAEDKKKKKE